MQSFDENMRLKCALVFLGPYPHGNVASIRIHSYCKALVKKGAFVNVLLIAPCKEAASNKNKEGVFDGVHYKYMTKITWESEKVSRAIKGIYYIIGLLKSLRYIKRDNINCLLSYHNFLISNVFYWITTRILAIPFIIDKTEYPYGYHKMSKTRKKYEHFKLRLYDGIIVISKELVRFYCRINSNVFHLPMTIDTDRFKGLKKQNQSEQYIAVVFGTHNRDGLYESVVSYSLYSKIAGEDAYKMMLIGNFDALSDKNKIQQYIIDNKLYNQIVIKGLIAINEVPQLLINASCLLTTPNEYVSGGFPTKLGEYMLSGVPVVATEAGEVGDYVAHMENILISQPGNLDDVASNILYIQNNNKEALLIAKNAKRLAEGVFNADSYADNLVAFINRLSSSHK